jgi:hypothetical protein
VALKEHLHDASSTTKVAINLEWRVRAEEIRISATSNTSINKGGLEQRLK